MRSKSALFSICILLIVYVSLEMMSLGVYSLSQGKAFSFADLAAYQKTLPIDDPAIQSDDANFTLHPYLGFVRSPGAYVSSGGFYAEQDPLIASRDPHIAIVGIAGGSVAEFLYTTSKTILHDYVDALPQFKNKKVVFTMFGMWAYHQPQQSLAVEYYLMQGGRLDMLINLDGRNEAIHRLVSNDLYLTYPFFGDGGILPQQRYDLNVIAKYYRILAWKKVRQIALYTVGQWHTSVTASTAWLLMDQYAAQAIRHAEDAFRQQLNTQKPYFMTGPGNLRNASLEDRVNFKTTLWEQGSKQLYALSKAYDFQYFHFLQPTQYVPGSKSFTEEEKTRYIDPNYAEKDYQLIPKVYPVFQSYIPEMQKQGIAIYDLTQIFQTTPQTVYSDNCCHLNKEGNAILAKAIGQRITNYFKAAASSAH